MNHESISVETRSISGLREVYRHLQTKMRIIFFVYIFYYLIDELAKLQLNTKAYVIM